MWGELAPLLSNLSEPPMRVPAEQIAKALGGHRSNDGWLCRCPLATHGKRNGDRRPSLFIKDGTTALLVKCFAGCDSRDVLDDLRLDGFMDDTCGDRGRSEPFRDTSSRFASRSPESAPNPKALRLWMSSISITGTLGEIYLRRNRGLIGPYPPSIRFKHVMNDRLDAESPAILAAVARADRKIIAVQVTFLTDDAQKAPGPVPRRTIGKLGEGAVRLGSHTNVLGLAEGVETALSAMEIFGVPCWATLGAARLPGVKVPAGVKTIHIFGDNDDPGREAAERAAERYTHEGRRVILRFPPERYGDYNDIKRVNNELAA